MQERQARFAARAEIAAEAKVDTGEHAVEDIAAQIVRAGSGRRRVGREQADDTRRAELDRDRRHDAEAEGQGNGIPEGLPRPLRLVRAEILRGEGRDGRQQRGRDEEDERDELLHDANRRRVGQAALVGDDRDDEKADLHKAVLREHRKANAQDLPHDGLLRAEIRLLQRDHAAFSDGKQRDEEAERLRERRAEGSPGGAHVQRAHEEIVQRDIRRAGDGDEVHGTLAVAHAAEDGAEDIIGRDERDAAEADGQIGGRAVDGLGGRGHDSRDGADEQEQDRRQRERHDSKQCDGIAGGLCGLRPVARADGAGDGDRGAHGESHEHDCQHVHDLRADGDRSRRGDALVLADDEQVGHAVERLQEIGKQIGQREADNVAENAAGGQILFHGNSSFSRPPRPPRLRRGLRIFAARPDGSILHPMARFVSSFSLHRKTAADRHCAFCLYKNLRGRQKFFLPFFGGYGILVPRS